MVVLVTGASGQLGQALRFIAPLHKSITFHFVDSNNGDITDKEKKNQIFTDIKPDYCINAAAYTAVDKAESEQDKAIALNVQGPANLAVACNESGTILLHISTDFVFDGKKNSPYTEEDDTNPESVYGITKRDGELEIQKALKAYYIIRTSWLYSQFGNNFLKTMLRLSKEHTVLSVVNDQIGTPTLAIDLAHTLLSIINSRSEEYGIYHYSNEGETTWYGFAKEIFAVNNVAIDLVPIPSTAYPTPARRPAYSVLDKSKIKKTFGLKIQSWESALTNMNHDEKKAFK